jgi:hypothetical protein
MQECRRHGDESITFSGLVLLKAVVAHLKYGPRDCDQSIQIRGPERAIPRLIFHHFHSTLKPPLLLQMCLEILRGTLSKDARS